MVALLNDDVSLIGSRHDCSERAVRSVGSGSRLTFGLGRRVDYLVVLSLVTLGLVLGVRVAQAAAAEEPIEGTDVGAAVVVSESTYVVQPGDTMWGIAVELAPEGDPRPLVDELVELNGSAVIAVGDEIVLPAGVATS